MNVLVTGGCGYVGSHIVKRLSENGYKVIVLDNLSTGFREMLIHAEKLIVGDLSDTYFLDEVFSQNNIESVIHCAASRVVEESVVDPLKYYSNNTKNTLNLIKACLDNKVKKFLFSSTAAVYGTPQSGVAEEDTPLVPINPYGASKMMSEKMLVDCAKAYDLNYVILRYFNVAGADPQSRIGLKRDKCTLLIKACCEAAAKQRKNIEIFGTDLDTPDGTCIRDYIHVEDLADAHLKALEYQNAGKPSIILNVGYGEGHSVKEVIQSVKKISGVNFDVVESSPREGDPVALTAKTEEIERVLGWIPRFNSLDKIVLDSWNWEKKNLGIN